MYFWKLGQNFIHSYPIYLESHTCVTFCDQDTVFEQPVRTLSEAQVEEMGLKYYNSDVHKAAFALPQFVKVSQPCLSTMYAVHFAFFIDSIRALYVVYTRDNA